MCDFESTAIKNRLKIRYQLIDSYKESIKDQISISKH